LSRKNGFQIVFLADGWSMAGCLAGAGNHQAGTMNLATGLFCYTIKFPELFAEGTTLVGGWLDLFSRP
jgi:hypothetical protein